MRSYSAALLCCLTGLSHVLMGISACEPNIDDDEDGYTSDIDCDDKDGDTYPGAPEQCDGIDNNCDGTVDESVPDQGGLTWWPDADGDGYGLSDAPMLERCARPEGYAGLRGDCDDSNRGVHPGAVDASGDGLDTSCDGVDGLAPSVGLSSSSVTTLQAALDAAASGQTVWVGPGTYAEYGLTMRGKAVALRSLAGELNTVIDGQARGTVLYFNTKETSASVLDGFTLTGGEASSNLGASSTTPSYSGGGIFMTNAGPTLTHLRIAANHASFRGAGIYADGGSGISLSDVRLEDNRAANTGGGMSLLSADVRLKRVTFLRNQADPTFAYGGGLDLLYGGATLEDVDFIDNSAYRGAGVALGRASLKVTRGRFLTNSATNRGGAVANMSSGITFTQVALVGNRATDSGSAIYASGESSGSIYQSVFTGNQGRGALFMEGTRTWVYNSVVAYNQDGNIVSTDVAGEMGSVHYGAVNLRDSVLFNPEVFSKYADSGVYGAYAVEEPGFLYYTDSGTGASCTPGTSLTCLPSDWHLSMSSPLIDAGDSTLTDADGSRSDIGLYGGAGGDDWDRDQDEVHDYFWPGTWFDVPAGSDATAFDCDDTDPSVAGGQDCAAS